MEAKINDVERMMILGGVFFSSNLFRVLISFTCSVLFPFRGGGGGVYVVYMYYVSI